MRGDRGSAVVEFVAVVPLVLLVGLTVLQVALLAHAQSIVGAAATHAARAAAVSVEPRAAARQAAHEIVSDALGAVPITAFELVRTTESGMPVVSVAITATPHLALLPDFIDVHARGSALAEARQ